MQFPGRSVSERLTGRLCAAAWASLQTTRKEVPCSPSLVHRAGVDRLCKPPGDFHRRLVGQVPAHPVHERDWLWPLTRDFVVQRRDERRRGTIPRLGRRDVRIFRQRAIEIVDRVVGRAGPPERDRVGAGPAVAGRGRGNPDRRRQTRGRVTVYKADVRSCCPGTGPPNGIDLLSATMVREAGLIVSMPPRYVIE